MRHKWLLPAVLLAGSVSAQTLPAPTLMSPSNDTQMTLPVGQIMEQMCTWSSVNGATAYYGQVSLTTTFSSYAIITSFDPSSLLYAGAYGVILLATSLSNLIEQPYSELLAIPGATYYWRVNASNTSDFSSWSNIWSFTIAGASDIPASPSLIYPPTTINDYNPTEQSVIPRNLTLQWISPQDSFISSQGPSYIVSYTVQLSVNENFSDSQTINITKQSWAPGMLLSNTTYYWRVNASNSYGTSQWALGCFTIDGTSVLNRTLNVTTLGYSGTLAIYDLNGKQVEKIPFTSTVTKQAMLKSVSLSKGTYIYRFLHNRQIMDVGRIIR